MKRLYLVICLAMASVSAQAETLKDPTKPRSDKSMLNTAQDDLPTMALKLTAIINNNQNKQAIINGISFAEGQEVQGYKVILIGQNHVLLDGSEGKQMLYVNNNNIKKDANNGF